ncbi:hypothetical protein K402DRAFT_463620 [Aulographum hederae CBS 113979]|uniref:CNH domain-containing protein n=1 Tax=Aulographum hederae CBS 113979 TaxID=1176131 RepID=A0A6G1GZX0_9PEZI|nr:hypothetical protein K402DRAFT_463620 [Aulographum hederae CBS 113979]
MDPIPTLNAPDQHTSTLETGSFILRSLLSDIPLSDGDATGVKITCVELWDENLYVGTSAGEIVHFFRIPPDPDDPSGQPSFIFASRLQPPVIQSTGDGVQQILLLPKVGKACVLCNNSLSFYSLPELSPAFTRLNLKPLNCVWVGGLDQDAVEDNSHETGVVVMLCLRTKLRLVRIGEEPVKIRDIEFGGCLDTVRRGNFACAADSRSYALLDVVHQQKIPLFPISPQDEEPPPEIGPPPRLNVPSGPTHGASRSVSTTSGRQEFDGRTRSSSLGIFGGPQKELTRPPGSGRHGFDAPESISRLQSPSPRPRPGRSGPPAERPLSGASLFSNDDAAEKALPPIPRERSTSRQPSPEKSKTSTPLRPHIASPTPTEFLLTTGTGLSDPGVGMFVNLDGDVSRGTIEFSSYPDSLVTDGQGVELSAMSGENIEEGFVLAVLKRIINEKPQIGVEILRWDVDHGEGAGFREWLSVQDLVPSGTGEGEDTPDLPHVGIKRILSPAEISITAVSAKLAMKKLTLAHDDEGKSLDAKSISNREKEELGLASRFCQVQGRNVLWINDQIWWIVRNPMVVRLDSRLQSAQSAVCGGPLQPQREKIELLINDIRGQESRTEADFFGLNYIRQKAAMLLFMDLVIRTASGIIVFEHEIRTTEEAMFESEIDPRVMINLLPVLQDEVVESPQGIWIPGGLKEIIDQFLEENDVSQMPVDTSGPFGDNLLQLMKRYLFHWRRKKGFGSVTDSQYVFHTVDATLLHILLLLDQQNPPGPASAGSVRAELNSVVDHGVDCFDRAIFLLEDFKRLYILSRLYQSRKLSSKVLATWKRILDGETDLGGDFLDGEGELRKYLSKIRDANVVKAYGVWLANRAPKLGVQVFADDHSRVTFSPPEALAILREGAPGAVKDYLEHLVFGKKQTKHAIELISYYLTIVLSALETSPAARTSLAETYQTYRALRPPKPTYRQFITDNAIGDEWWHSRLRLLQLLGSAAGEEASAYDVPTILDQLRPWEKELVPEMIILYGRLGRHEEAIRLLVHGLGDYDTAVVYCLLGGGIYRPSGHSSTSGGSGNTPTYEEQRTLFSHLLREFLLITDLTQRIERTGELLERFGQWFDVQDVLLQIPDNWNVEIFRGFLVDALRRLVRERRETGVVRALCGVVNLRAAAEVGERVKELGPTVEKVG